MTKWKNVRLSVDEQIEACKYAIKHGDEAAAVKYRLHLDTIRKMRKRHGFPPRPRKPYTRRAPAVAEPFED